MSGNGLSYKEIAEQVAANEEKLDTIDVTHLQSSGSITSDACDEIFKSLSTNNVVTTVIMANVGIGDSQMEAICEMIKSNTTVKNLDIGYNKIGPKGMTLLATALIKNSTLSEMKIHRQSVEMGTTAETALVDVWDTNITLTRLYCTLHDRRCNQKNTAGEVRNKEISKRIASGSDFLDLDPNRAEEYKQVKEKELAEKEEKERIANAPVSSKVESTGGPYTYKQLTCKKQFRPDDVDTKQRETYLGDEEFEELFGTTKEEFAKLANWKKLGKKKEHNLH